MLGRRHIVVNDLLRETDVIYGNLCHRLIALLLMGLVLAGIMSFGWIKIDDLNTVGVLHSLWRFAACLPATSSLIQSISALSLFLLQFVNLRLFLAVRAFIIQIIQSWYFRNMLMLLELVDRGLFENIVTFKIGGVWWIVSEF